MKLTVGIGQLWKIKEESKRNYRDDSHLVCEVDYENKYFKDEYNRKWSWDLLQEHYTVQGV